MGIALTLFGAAALAASLGDISSVVYPIVWWGVIFLIDAVNFKKWGTSLIHGNHRHAFLVLVPLSAIFWLYFEFLNIIYPHWYYIGIGASKPVLIFMSVTSFGTVIPIIVELLWFFAGPVTKFPLTRFSLDILSKYWPAVIFMGAACFLLPFFTKNFLINQLMWLGPFLLLLPFLSAKENLSEELSVVKKFWIFLFVVGLISGLLWEFLNYWAGGKWKYILWEDMLHLFEMPILGYVGFIPFAFSTVALYLFAKKFLPAKLITGILLYLAAILLSYLFISIQL